MADNNIKNFTDKSFEITPTLDTSAYASGDLLFNPIKVCDKGDSSRRGRIIGVDVVDSDDQGENLEIWFGIGTASLGTLNAAVDLSTAEAQDWFGKFSLTLWEDWTSVQKSSNFTTEVPYGLGFDEELYCFGISKGAGTYSADGLKVRVWLNSEER